MNYKRLLENILYVAGTHKLVGSSQEGDNIYQINHEDVVYPLFFITPQPHTIDNPISNYKFIFYYIDRLIDNKSNRIDIHNSAIKCLNDVVLDVDQWENTESIRPFTTTLFTEKFSDECAGAFIEINIQTYNDNNECNSLHSILELFETEVPNNIITTENNQGIQTN